MERLSGSNSVTGSSASKPEPSAVHRRVPARPGWTFWGIHRHSFRRFLRLTGMPRGATSVTSDIDFSLFLAVFLEGF